MRIKIFLLWMGGGRGAEDVQHSCLIITIVTKIMLYAYQEHNIAADNYFHTAYIQIHVPRLKSPNLIHKV